MFIDEYLNIVCEEIRWKAARASVREELRSHIEQRADELMLSGETSEGAEIKAVAHMGDAVIAGRQLNRVHRPRYDWVLLVALALLLGLGLLYTATTGNVRAFGPWPVATAAGLVCAVFFSFADIRKWMGKKKVYLSVFFSSVLLLAAKYAIHEYLHCGMAYLDRFPVFGMFTMILSAGFWVKDIKSSAGMAAYAVCMLIGGCALAFTPSQPLAVPFLICAWAMLWTVRVGSKRISVLLLAGFVFSGLLLCYLTYQPYWHLRVDRMLSDSGSLPMQIQYYVQHLSLFGAGGIGQEIYTGPAPSNEYALIHFMWRYGLFAGLSVICLCAVLLWRTVKTVIGMRDTAGKAVAVGLCVYIALQMVWNILVNMGLLPEFNMSTFIPMFSQAWTQTIILGSAIGILIGLNRRRELYQSSSRALGPSSREDIAL